MVECLPSKSFGFLRAGDARSNRVRHTPDGMVILYLNESKARRLFKELLGNANHLIVTALVGLDAIEQGLVTDVPEQLHAAWSPKDRMASARRSRRLVLDMVLVRAVDALDLYIRASRRNPALVQDDGLRNAIDAAGRSIFEKLRAIESHYGHKDPLLFAMGYVMIAWRNRSAHTEADTEVDQRTRELLLNEAKRIEEIFSGLSAERLLDGFDNHSPAFKEVASMIRATHQLVQTMEASQFASLNVERYLRDLIWYSVDTDSLNSADAEKKRKSRMQSIWGQDISDRERAFVRMLISSGLSETKKYETSVVFEPELLEKLKFMSPLGVFDWTREGRTIQA
jgi:hypothetical protein